MIAKGRVIEFSRVPGFDHLRTLVLYRFYRGGNSVTSKKKKGIWIFFLDLLLQSHDAGNAAAHTMIYWRELVNVIELQQRNLDEAIGL